MPAHRCLLLLCLVAGAVAADLATPISGARVYFTPGDDTERAVVAELGKATTTILVQTYSFTSVPIARALTDAQQRGVAVRVLSDKENESAKYTALDWT